MNDDALEGLVGGSAGALIGLASWTVLLVSSKLTKAGRLSEKRDTATLVPSYLFACPSFCWHLVHTLQQCRYL